MNRKKVALGIVLVTVGILLWMGFGTTAFGFSVGQSGMNLKIIDHYAFSANYKQDANSEWGRKTAVYQNHIYYSDPVNKGIFRMDLDGSEEQPVLQCPDIRKLQLSKDGIYYLGFVGNKRLADDEYRSFRLFLFDWLTARTENLMETSRYAHVYDWELELWDFYVSEEKIANLNYFNMEVAENLGIMLYCTSSKGLVPYGEIAILRAWSFEHKESAPDSIYSEFYSIASYDQLFFSADSFGSFGNDESDYKFAWDGMSVADRQKNQSVMDTGSLMRDFGKPQQHRTIDSFLPDGVLVHVGNEMMLMTNDFQDSLRSTTLDGEHAIRFVVVSGEKAYIIAEEESKNRQQSVYEMDLKTFEYKKLYICAKGESFLWMKTKDEEKILWLDGEKLVTAQGKEIRIWTLTDGEYALNRTVETGQNVVAKNNKTDVAGDWLFVYQFSEENNRDELIEKVSIAVE